MKREKLFLHLPRIIILVVLICVVVTSVSFTAGSLSRMKEQHTGEVLLEIDRWLGNFNTADARNRDYKISVLNTLSEYQTQLKSHIVQSEEIDSEFSVAFNHIVDWFYNNYINMVNKVSEMTSENIGEIEQYLSEVSAEIDVLNSTFNSVEDPEENRENNAKLFAELYSKSVIYAYDDFIALKTNENDELIVELNKITGLIEDEGIVDTQKLAELSGMIDSFIKTYTETIEAVLLDADELIYRFDAELLTQETWFEEYYTQFIEKIVETERKDEFDDATVKNQIELLEYIAEVLEEDHVVNIDFILFNLDIIDELLEEYANELDKIAERIRLRDEAAARAAAAAAAAARRRNTPSTSTSNNRPGTSSGTSSGAGGGTISSSGRYPAITANCREILARVVKLESPNEPADGKQAVAEVVLNRMISSRWDHANTVEAVVFDTRWGTQFAVKDLVWTDRGTPTSADYAAVDRALNGPNVLAKEYMFFRTTAVTQNDVVWIGAHAFSK